MTTGYAQNPRMAKGIYKPLLATASTRLLSPSGAGDAGIIRCELRDVDLNQVPAPVYSALSYVWHDLDPNGASPAAEKILCCGEEVAVTANLHAALDQIWKRWPDMLLWVDAVCINQEDEDEKAQQVAMMGEIYSKATTVLVWLGVERIGLEDFGLVSQRPDLPTATSFAFNTLLRVLQYPTDATRAIMQLARVSDSPYITIDPGCDDIRSVTAPLADVLHRQWFSRAWTLQELLLAREALVISGDCSAPWDEVAEAVKLLGRGVFFLKYLQQEVKAIEECAEIVRSDHGVLRNLLVATRHRKATNPRDKIYSLMHLVDRKRYGGIHIDYRADVSHVFAEAATAIIADDGDLSILAAAGLENSTRGQEWLLRNRNELWANPWTKDDEERERRADLPSWVPDFTQPSALSRLQQTERPLPEQTANDLSQRRRKRHWPGPNAIPPKLGPSPNILQLQIHGMALGILKRNKQETGYTLHGFSQCVARWHRGFFQKLFGKFKQPVSPMTTKEVMKKISDHENSVCSCSRHKAKGSEEACPLTIMDGDDDISPAAQHDDWYCLFFGSESSYILRPRKDRSSFFLVGCTLDSTCSLYQYDGSYVLTPDIPVRRVDIKFSID